MMKTKNLKPKGDVRVRKPDGTYLATEEKAFCCLPTGCAVLPRVT